MASGIVVDSDSHIMEPADTWKEYMDPEFRDRALRINVDEFGLEYLDIDGKVSIGYNGGTLGRIAGIDQTREWMMEHPTLPYDEIKNIAPGSVDPHARVKHLDKEGVDKTFLFPTLGLGWEAECEDPALSAAYCRAYNRWLVDFCKPHPDRLFPIAHITVRDVSEGVKELERAAKDGMRGAFICPAPMNGIRYSHEYYDPFWATAQDLDMPITFHVVLNPDYPGRNSYPEDESGLGPVFFNNVMTFPDPLISFTCMMGDGTFEKFPRLKLSMVEIGCTWVLHWLDMMDFKTGRFSFDMPLTMAPSDYFRRQVWVSAEPIEKGLGMVAQMVGTDRFTWGSDWPHPEGHTDPLNKVKANIASLPEADQNKILGENALAMYGLSVPAPAVG